MPRPGELQLGHDGGEVIAMMHDWNDGYNAWWWMIPMMVFMVAVVGTVVWALVRVLSTDRPTAEPASPEQVLAQRLAAGVIDAAEYHERVDALHGKVRPSS